MRASRLSIQNMGWRAFALVGLLLLASLGVAQQNNGTVTLLFSPSVQVADGRSTVTVTAEVRSKNGTLAPDGTQVLFDAVPGEFTNPLVTTINGIARAKMVSPSVPGIAKITASAFALGATATVEYEFVASTRDLSSAKEFIEVYSPRYLMYSPEQKIVAAAVPERGARLVYREIEIEADDLQLRVPTYEVRAINAKLKIGRIEREYDRLYLKLNSREGKGITTYEGSVTRVFPMSGFPYMRAESDQRSRVGVVDIKRGEIKAYNLAVPQGTFELADLGESMTLVSARRAYVFPAKEIQFQRADVYVGGARVMRVPLFQISPQANTPVLTDQFFNITNNQLAVNYPYYLTLKPGLSSLMRLRTGTRYSTGAGAGGGTFLDYELRWNRGDEFDGGLAVTGLARKDWGIRTRQYLRLGTRTTASFLLDFPAHRSLLGNVDLSHSLGAYQLNYNGSIGTAVQAPRFRSSDHLMSIDRDPMPVGSLPLRFDYGVVGSYNEFRGEGIDSTRNALSLRTRLNLLPLQINRMSSFNAVLSFSRQFGRGTDTGINTRLFTTLSSRSVRNASVILNYEFVDDQFSSQYLGKHRLSARTNWSRGQVDLSFFANKSLDIDRFQTVTELSWRLGGQWRAGASHLLDRYAGSSYPDLSMFVGYNLGLREVGISWSQRNKRLGLEILGASY